MKIWGHMLVRNEEKWIWFAANSVIKHLDKLLIWDTGSTDNTLKIIDEIKASHPEKIQVKKLKPVTPEGYTNVKQKMLDETRADWFITVDGDEVWWEDSISRLVDVIRNKGENLESIISSNYNVVGDVFHFQPESAGRYVIDSYKGHINIRATSRKIPGLHLEKPHGQQGSYDGEGTLIQERSKKKRIFVDGKYLHFTNVQRSGGGHDKKVPKRSKKLKYEIGPKFPSDFYYPEVFFKKKPKIVPSPWQTMNRAFFLRALFETPLRKVKRKLIHGKVGY